MAAYRFESSLATLDRQDDDQVLQEEEGIALIDPPSGPVLLLGDSHGDAGALAYALRELELAGGDTLIQLGDFGWFTGRNGGPPDFAVKVSKIAVRLNKRVLWFRGNHENQWSLGYRENAYPTEPLEVLPNITFLPDGIRFLWNGTRVVVVGGGVSVDKGQPWRAFGTGWWPEETIHPEVAEMIKSDGPADVMLSHDCPSGVTLHGSYQADGESASAFNSTNILESKMHQRVVRDIVEAVQPKYLYHGHYHTRRDEDLVLTSGQVCHIVGLNMSGPLPPQEGASILVNEHFRINKENHDN